MEWIARDQEEEVNDNGSPYSLESYVCMSIPYEFRLFTKLYLNHITINKKKNADVPRMDDSNNILDEFHFGLGLKNCKKCT